MSVAILKYNAGNVRSVAIALDRLGAEHVITDDHDQIRTASHVIMPGVGEASTAMNYLSERGLPEVISELTQPVLGICLGLQLLCSHTEENDTACIGVFPETVRLFREARKVPHIGWNRVDSSGVRRSASGVDVLKDFFYFVHSYYAEIGPSTVAVTEYGETFASIMRRDNFLATQFHPEKSADAGYQILRNFLDGHVLEKVDRFGLIVPVIDAACT